MEFRKNNETSGLDGLRRAGVNTLESDKEIREVVDAIKKYGERDPLQIHAVNMDGFDLKVFFEKATKKNLNFFITKDLIALIEKI